VGGSGLCGRGKTEVERILRDWCDVPSPAARCDLILTVGGTGHTDKDFLPKVTQGLLKEPMPEISALLCRVAANAGYVSDEYSRGVAGKREQTLLINLPGNVTGLADPQPLLLMTQTLLPILPNLLAAPAE
jgi:molybdopterin biosynthesis enzyme MoaB